MRGTWLLASLWLVSIMLAIAGVLVWAGLGPSLLVAAVLLAVWSYLVVDVESSPVPAAERERRPFVVVDGEVA